VVKYKRKRLAFFKIRAVFAKNKQKKAQAKGAFNPLRKAKKIFYEV